MVTNFEVRFLLALWDLGGADIRKGSVNSRFSGKTAEATAACASLIKAGAVNNSKESRCLTLTDAGKLLLESSLVKDNFEFEAQIGAKTANALLNWFRANANCNQRSLPKDSKQEAIASYDQFKEIVLTSYDRLNSDFNFDRLVPIYRIRRDIGDRVARTSFNEWLLKMQAEGILQLLEGTVEDSAPDKLEDSVITKVSGLRCYAKRIDT
jgi:RecG-like helicase